MSNKITGKEYPLSKIFSSDQSSNGRTEWTKLDGRTFAQVGH